MVSDSDKLMAFVSFIFFCILAQRIALSVFIKSAKCGLALADGKIARSPQQISSDPPKTAEISLFKAPSPKSPLLSRESERQFVTGGGQCLSQNFAHSPPQARGCSHVGKSQFFPFEPSASIASDTVNTFQRDYERPHTIKFVSNSVADLSDPPRRSESSPEVTHPSEATIFDYRQQLLDDPGFDSDEVQDNASSSSAVPTVAVIPFASLLQPQAFSEGNFGKVYCARIASATSARHKWVVLKVPKQRPGHDELSELYAYLKLPPHHNVLPFLGVCKDVPYVKFSAICLVTELQPLTLLQYITALPVDKQAVLLHEQPTLGFSMTTLKASATHQHTLRLLIDMALGVGHLHSHGLLHRC